MPPEAELEAERSRVLAPELEAERNRVVVQLAGAVAHKLKQPLAVAWGYLELLLDDPSCSASLDANTRRYLNEIQDALRTMDEVINRLQQATVHHTRPYAGSLEILDLDPPQPVA
jgi:two-component system cell cycle response regulator